MDNNEKLQKYQFLYAMKIVNNNEEPLSDNDAEKLLLIVEPNKESGLFKQILKEVHIAYKNKRLIEDMNKVV